MSIILKGIDIPKDAQAVQISYWTKDGRYITESYPSLRIVEIPTPHGRLIDADVFREECYKMMDKLMESTSEHLSMEALSLLCGFSLISDAPTILEAERGDDEFIY